MSYHDHIYPSYEEETVKILHEMEEYKLLDDPKLEPIIIALRKGPLTVRELEEEYNLIVGERVMKMDLSQKEKDLLLEKLFRKSKTLYKYLNVLEKKGFVVPAGKRIVENQTASETLYGRTAKLFLFQGGKEEWDNSEVHKSSLNLLSQVIGLINKKKAPSVTSLKKILNKIETKMVKDIDSLFIDLSEEFSKLADDVTYTELTLMLFGLKILMLMKSYPEFEDELKENRII